MTSSGSAWVVYVLECRDGSLYTGITNDLSHRLRVHAVGQGGAYTRARRPVRLVFVESQTGRGAALRREAAVKRLSRGAKLALVEGTT